MWPLRASSVTTWKTTANSTAIIFIAIFATLTTPALALDLNTFRAQHGRPALSMSVRLFGIGYQQAALMAGAAASVSKAWMGGSSPAMTGSRLQPPKIALITT
jgi:hypothetical protein